MVKTSLGWIFHVSSITRIWNQFPCIIITFPIPSWWYWFIFDLWKWFNLKLALEYISWKCLATNGTSTLDPFYFFKFNPLGLDASYTIYGSYGRNNCPEAKGLVNNANFLFTKKLILYLNANRPLSIYQLQLFGSKTIVCSKRPMDHKWSILIQRVTALTDLYIGLFGLLYFITL